MKIDLHLHSSESLDGEATPQEMASLVRQAGLSVAAIADHNQVTGIDAFIEAAGRSIDVIPAIEIDTSFKGFEPHILGYFIDHHDPVWQHLAQRIFEIARKTTKVYANKIRALGIFLDQDRLDQESKNGIAATELMTKIALEDPHNAGNEILKPYRPGKQRGDMPLVNFYWDWCASGKPCHTGIEYMGMDEAIRMITDTGGIPVLAHPGQTFSGQETRALDALSCGLRGIEVFSGYHDSNQCRYWQEVATKHSMLITCGSDWHGSIKPNNFMGVHGADDTVCREIIQNLLQARR